MPVKNYLQALFYLICRYTVEHSIAPIISSNVSLCSMVFCYGRKLYIYNIYYICMCIYIYEHIHIYYICYIYMLYEYMLYIYIYIYISLCVHGKHEVVGSNLTRANFLYLKIYADLIRSAMK